jgi:hypothetical protein
MTEPHPSSRPADEAELVELIHSIDLPAPDSLHRKVDTMVAARSRGTRGRASGANPGAATRSGRLLPRLAAVGTLAAAAVALVLAFSLEGGSSTLSLRDAAALTVKPATQAPPAEQSDHRDELAANVDGISFPYWGGRLGWHASGARTDRIAGRTVRTIFYENGHGRRIGYAIVSGPTPERPGGGVVSRRDGTPYWTLTVRGAPVVTWLRDGHLCVVSGHNVSGTTLLRLASWDDRRSEAS